MASRCGMWSEPFTSTNEADGVLPVRVRLYLMAEMKQDGRRGPGTGGGSLSPGRGICWDLLSGCLQAHTSLRDLRGRPLNSTADTDPWTPVPKNLSLPLDPHWDMCVSEISGPLVISALSCPRGCVLGISSLLFQKPGMMCLCTWKMLLCTPQGCGRGVMLGWGGAL